MVEQNKKETPDSSDIEFQQTGLERLSEMYNKTFGDDKFSVTMRYGISLKVSKSELTAGFIDQVMVDDAITKEDLVRLVAGEAVDAQFARLARRFPDCVIPSGGYNPMACR